MAELKKKRKFKEKLTNKYRLVILNDETFEERASFRLSRFNVYVISSTLVLVLIAIMFFIIIFTPLKEYIPGYGDVNLRKDLVSLKLKSDSLGTIASQQEMWIMNIKNILEGNIDTSAIGLEDRSVQYDTIRLDRIPEEDARLREEMEREDNYALIFSSKINPGKISLANISLFPPVKGYITSGFAVENDHYGIDIVAPDEEPVKAILDGTVIVSSWTLETGYIIGIQHEYNLVSFYKHNSILLKKVGNFVKAGDAIAIIGSSGELTTGPHLHFEIWLNGIPVNPEDYIVF